MPGPNWLRGSSPGEPIAVVGRGCVLPGACDPDGFWDVVANGETALRTVPSGYWGVPAASVLGGNGEDGHTRTDVGGYVTGFSSMFDPGAYRLPANLVTELDPVFQWVLHGAGAALREAGQDALTARAGLVLGNLSYPSAGLSRYAEAVWREVARPHPYNRFCSGLPAQVAARGLGLGLGGYAIDAACASSLYAIALACRRLQDGKADLMVAGGVNAADDLFLHVSFSSLSALSGTGRSRPFHRAADGLVPAEGAAFLALMRLSDAIAADAEIHGVIRGVGLSNDGTEGGFLVPSEEGQRRAMLAAYQAAGVSPDTVGLVECHATGTPVGDAVEARSTARFFAGSSDVPVGSVKSNIGHAITAAGGAAMLKVLGALRHGIRPPTLSADEPIPELDGTPLRLVRETEEWTGPRRAAVSAFGFGGNNAHLVIDAWHGDDLGTVLPIPAHVPREPERPEIAVVAIGARVGAGADLDDLRRDLLGAPLGATARETIEVVFDGLRFPPLDLQQAHAQQVLVLEAAREAAAATTLPADRTMVLVGMGCDPEVARIVARWRAPEWLAGQDRPVDPRTAAQLRDSLCPPQTSAAVVGAMPNVVANRINVQLGLTGPGFAVSAEETSGIVALDIGLAALRSDAADAVLVGAVDLSCEPVHQAALADLGFGQPTGDAAVVVVLKRLEDARSAGDTVLAVLDEPGDALPTDATLRVGDMAAFAEPGVCHFDPASSFGRSHAASGLLSVAVGVLAVHHRMRPRTGDSAMPMPGLTSVVCGSRPFEGPSVLVRLRAGDRAGLTEHDPPRLRTYSGVDKDGVLAALEAGRESPGGPARLVLVDEGPGQFGALTARAGRWLRGEVPKPAGMAFRETPISGEIAFVYSGGSMAYHGMGRELMLAFPEQVDVVAARCGSLDPVIGWAFDTEEDRPRHPLDQIGGASVLGQLHTLITRDLMGVRPDASLGYSSGESSALASLGAWPDVSSLVTDAWKTELFTKLVVAEMEVPRRAWREQGVEGGRWMSYLVSASADQVRAALDTEPVVHLMVVNSPESCVFGGEAGACERVLARLAGIAALPIPYEIAAHVPEVAEVRTAWRALHHLPTRAVPGVRFHTCSTGDWYVPTADAAADAITAQGMGSIDFAATVERAWQDGVRVFVEHGPGRQCAGWIGQTLGGRDHLALAIDAGDGRRVGQLFQVGAELVAAGIPVRVDELASCLDSVTPDGARTGKSLTLPAHPPRVRLPPVELPEAAPTVQAVQVMAPPPDSVPEPTADAPLARETPAVAAVDTPSVATEMIVRHATRVASAHRGFLRVQSEAHQMFLAWQSRISGLAGSAGSASVLPPAPIGGPPPSVTHTGPNTPTGPAFSRTQLERLATGPISELFGPVFTPQDGKPRQTRMPSPPLLLADRVLGIDAEPASLGTGTIWTETDVRLDAWYLDPAGRMSPGMQVEAGQADLLLISWLGVDLFTEGDRVYRLLGCELTFHGGPAKPGETLRYQIQIDGHEEHGGIRLFFFHYDAYAGDELRLSVRAGKAGFFTDDELKDTGGVRWDPGAEPPDPDGVVDPVVLETSSRSFTEDDVKAFLEGRLADCFGRRWDFARTHIRSPRLGNEAMRLLGRVSAYDPVGGPWGRGYLRAETPVTAGDWYFAGHFPNDPCMPGNLMLDGCFQAMAFYLAAGGHTVARDGWRFEPVPGAAFPMVCRGQVTPDSELLTYELFVSRLSAAPRPELTADLVCTVDGVRAFHVRDLRLRLVPDWPLDHWRQLGPPAVQTGGVHTRHRELAGLVGYRERAEVARVGEFPYDYAAMLACAWGKPTDAFGPAYAPFDGVRRLARLPGPPFHFMSRVVATEGPPWVLQTGSAVEVEYDVPPDVWYFQQNDHAGAMPFAVLMEVVLQASGWLASYVGSALTSDTDLLFRNLDGSGTVHREIGPGIGTLRTRTRLRDVSQSGEMIIQAFDVECTANGQPVFDLSTVFGFFPPSAFDNQAGLPPADEERELRNAPSEFSLDLRGRPARYFDSALSLPGPMLLMVDEVSGYWPDAGQAGLGRVRGEKRVNPDDWFFKAHFFQDPVQPGSLGVQALCQLLQFYAIERGLGNPERTRFTPVLLGEPVHWKYRGQVTPRSAVITMEVEILAVVEDGQETRILAQGWLWADDVRIYHVQRFGIGLVPVPN
ncbi:beta-ketoacyl synthase N-terminal-like domain-containing protein [Amycolatopsis sp. cg5]|uniref:beta-ketoacyl synthase N-terminal-like domain-containing protein n=1 Tax=Amycolatopsis sp. cg5 TaxID=3238802 RepID=UPI00352542CA